MKRSCSTPVTKNLANAIYRDDFYSFIRAVFPMVSTLIQDLRQYGIGAIAIDPVGDKVMRMAAQAAKIEAGMVYLPRKASWLPEFQREMMGFPRGNTDDQVDALSQALAYDSRPRGGWGVLTGLT